MFLRCCPVGIFEERRSGAEEYQVDELLQTRSLISAIEEAG